MGTPLKNFPPSRRNNQLLILLSHGVSSPIQEGNCRRALQLLRAKNVDYIEVDGMDPSQKSRRDELFGISGVRGSYPQIFVVTEQEETETALEEAEAERLTQDNLHLTTELQEQEETE